MAPIEPILGASSAQRDRRRLRVAQVTATFPPYRGGTGNVAYHNARELARRGHEVHVFTAGEGGAPPGSGITLHRARPILRLGNAPCAPGLGRALRGMDLVHLHYPYYFGAEQVWRSGRPYLVTYHQDVLFDGPLKSLATLHHRLLGERILRRARFVGATTLDYAGASRLRGLPPERLVELPNGVDLERFRPGLDARGLRARIGLGPEEPVILFVAALDRAHYFKGLPVLLDALARQPGVRLVVVGDGDLRPRYERLASQAGLGGQVHFAGRVPDEDLPSFYALSDLLVLPSTTRGEAFGLVLLEAMASARPVVASRLPGVRAVVEDGVDGLLTTPGDTDELAAKLDQLLADPGRRTAMGLAGRRKVEQRYDWRRLGDRLERLYFAALGLETVLAPAAMGAAC